MIADTANAKTTAAQPPLAENATTDYVTFRMGSQMFGVPVQRVQDILVPDRIAPVPLAPSEVRGLINLRGRIVTVIDVRIRLGLKDAREASARAMGVTVESGHELYTLLVDHVGDVITLASDSFEANPATIDSLWKDFSKGVHRLSDQLMVVLDIDRLLDIRARN
ncbi:MAG TPA: chemotaxis protein CheW [Alphaproteobacteria bacterium]|jgi:purine-binding chemotaxis protein CheW